MVDFEPASLVVEYEVGDLAPLQDVESALLPGFVEMVRALAPRGRAWNLHDGSVLMQVLSAIAQAAVDVELQIRRFGAEADPLRTLELLPEWEASLGLPDECLGSSQSVDERRAAIVTRLVGLQGASEPDILAFLSGLGFTVTIGHFEVCRIGTWTIAEPLLGPAWQFAIEIRYFGAGDRDLLRCALSHRLPAHVAAVYCFGEFTPADVLVEDEALAPVTIF